MGVNLRSGRSEVAVALPPSMWVTQPRAATEGNWMTAFALAPSRGQSTMAVVAGSDAANSS